MLEKSETVGIQSQPFMFIQFMATASWTHHVVLFVTPNNGPSVGGKLPERTTLSEEKRLQTGWRFVYG